MAGRGRCSGHKFNCKKAGGGRQGNPHAGLDRDLRRGGPSSGYPHDNVADEDRRPDLRYPGDNSPLEGHVPGKNKDSVAGGCQ